MEQVHRQGQGSGGWRLAVDDVSRERGAVSEALKQRRSWCDSSSCLSLASQNTTLAPILPFPGRVLVVRPLVPILSPSATTCLIPIRSQSSPTSCDPATAFDNDCSDLCSFCPPSCRRSACDCRHSPPSRLSTCSPTHGLTLDLTAHELQAVDTAASANGKYLCLYVRVQLTGC